LYSTYTTAENDNKPFDLWSGVTDVIQPSKGFTDEIYGHAITLRLKTCFRYIQLFKINDLCLYILLVLLLCRINNETEDAIRLEVKLFSGYYFDKISSSSVSDVHHGSHSNHIWFVFAKVGVHYIIIY